MSPSKPAVFEAEHEFVLTIFEPGSSHSPEYCGTTKDQFAKPEGSDSQNMSVLHASPETPVSPYSVPSPARELA
jgi:hypothetical protein